MREGRLLKGADRVLLRTVEVFMTIYACLLCGLRARFDRQGCDRGCEVARTGRSC